MREEVINYLTSLYNVLNRTRLKLYECDFLQVELIYNGKPLVVILENNKLTVRLKYDVVSFVFQENCRNENVLDKLVKRLEV